MLGLYALYAAVAIWMHPGLVYPFDPRPFEMEGYSTVTTQSDAGPLTVSVSEGEAGQPAVLFFMGNTGSLARFPTSMTQHQAAGRMVVAMQYPGGGGVDGAPSEGGLKDLALAGFDWVAANTDRPIYVHGYSLGTGLAVHVAARRGIAGLLLDAPFARMCDVMVRQSALPACYLPGVQRWDTLHDLEGITADVHIQHGDADQLIPASDGQRLARAMEAAGIDVTFHLVPGGTHNNIFRTDGYWDRVAAFMGR